jgi:FixJ family two-component response regulator
MQLTIRRGELRARFTALTKRELQVLAHVVLGRLNKQIAADLCIPRTDGEAAPYGDLRRNCACNPLRNSRD